MTKYNKFDLDIIATELGDHFDKYSAGTYTGICIECGSKVGQEYKECPDCATPTVWYHSDVWRDNHGDPRLVENELRGVKPSTLSGKLLLSRAGVPTFSNATEEQKWAQAERMLGTAAMDKITNYVTQTKKNRGRGAIRHALAIVRLRLEEHKQRAQKKAPTVQKSSDSNIVW
jgi:hypothetical protein